MTKTQRNLFGGLVLLMIIAAYFSTALIMATLLGPPRGGEGGAAPVETITVTPGPAIRDLPLPPAAR